MTEIQRTNIQVCNEIIAQPGQDKPFILILTEQKQSILGCALETRCFSCE